MIPLTAATEMDPRQTEIFAFCEKFFFDHENPGLVIKNARFFREGYDAFGLSEDELRQVRDEVFERFQPSIPELARLAPHFFATGKYEFGTLAIMFLKKHRPRLDRTVYEELRKVLDQGIDNWQHADLIATKLTPVLLELEIADMDDFAGWLVAESKWTRRVAAVTMLCQKDRLPVEEILSFIQPVMADRERAVQQGVGWLLKELWKLYPQQVEDFLFQSKETASKAIMQFATEKMHKDRKKRFRRAAGIPGQQQEQTEPRPQPEQRQSNKPGGQRKANKPRHLIPKRKPHYRKPVPSKEESHD